MSVRDSHNKAMDFAERAFMARLEQQYRDELAQIEPLPLFTSER